MILSISVSERKIYVVVVGVGMLLGPRVLKFLNSIEKIQPRLMVTTFNGNSSTTIVCYSASDERDLDTFYKEVSSLFRSFPIHNVLIIVGDINAQIGKNENNKFSLHNSSNRNDKYLTDFSLENEQICLNTKFQKRKGKLWTHTHTQIILDVDPIWDREKQLGTRYEFKDILK